MRVRVAKTLIRMQPSAIIKLNGTKRMPAPRGGDAIHCLEALGYVDYYDVVGNAGEEGDDQSTDPDPDEEEAPGKDWLWAPIFARDYTFVTRTVSRALRIAQRTRLRS